MYINLRRLLKRLSILNLNKLLKHNNLIKLLFWLNENSILSFLKEDLLIGVFLKKKKKYKYQNLVIINLFNIKYTILRNRTLE